MPKIDQARIFILAADGSEQPEPLPAFVAKVTEKVEEGRHERRAPR